MPASSPLLGLPVELRLEVYSHLFRRGEVDVLVSDTITSRPVERNGLAAGTRFAAILRTCHKIHGEAAGVLYEQTTFRISLGARGGESVDQSGRLCLRTTGEKTAGGAGSPLRDLSLFEKMQNVHLSLDFGSQVNPIWDALPVIRAIMATLNPSRKHTTASLRFGLVTAITCARLPDAPWQRFVQEVKGMDLDYRPEIEMDRDAERWSKHGRQRFDDFAAEMGGELRFVRFEESLGPHDEGLRACVIH